MAIDKNRKSRKYRAALIDAVTHERLWSIVFTRPAFIAAIVSLVVLLLVIFYLLIAFTPLRSFIPGYPDAQARRQAVQNAIRIDSLETQILQWELYTENLKKVVAGEEPLLLDSLPPGLGSGIAGDESAQRREGDEKIEKQQENDGGGDGDHDEALLREDDGPEPLVGDGVGDGRPIFPCILILVYSHKFVIFVALWTD